MTHSLTWQVPLSWGHNLSVSGAYTQQSPNLGPNLGSVGLTQTLSVNYTIPMGTMAIAGYDLGGSQELGLGFDYKRTNNNLSFGGTSVNHAFTEVNQFSLSHTLSVPDGWGQTSLQSKVVVSPGNLTSRNTDAAFQPGDNGQSGTIGAHAKYSYVRLTLTRLVPLPSEFGLSLKLTGQYADQTLLPSEQLSIAGVDAVRGYQEGSITGSTGFTSALEISGPS